MTGSSADGLDICLVDFSGKTDTPTFTVIFSTEIPYPKHFQLAFRNPLELSDHDVAIFDTELGTWFADEIAKLDLKFDVIASHGQTIKHEPPHFTQQIGEPSFMKQRFDVPVIYDFRSADIKQGGQGAPLIPIVDRFLFQQEQADVLALNIGGIANLTVIPATLSSQPLLAWDTGPGNTLIDKAVRLYSNDTLAYDPEGRFAAEGVLNQKLLSFLLEHKFYQLTPPRSAGQEQFGLVYFNQILKQFSPETDQQFKDLIYTLTVLTVKTIVSSVNECSADYDPQVLFIGGGGCFNNTMLKLLEAELPHIDIRQVDHSGITTSNKEAFGFAYLGYLNINDLPGNIPSVTGASRQTILGSRI